MFNSNMKKQQGLHHAAKVGDLKEFKQLVKQLTKKSGGKITRVVDEKDEYYQTPLHIACFEGHLDIVKYLVDKCKANIYARDKNNWTPLHASATGLTQAHVKVCAFLLDRGAETEAQTNDASTPLHYFVRMDPEDILEFHKVLERMASPDGKAREGMSARSDIQRASKLVNAQNKHGESALHHAAIKGREQSAIFLHHIGADVNLRNKYGETPLIVAIRSARPEMAKLLLSLGADASIKAEAGTALELAKSAGLDDVIAEIQGQSKPRGRGKTLGSSLGEEDNVGFGFIVGSDTESDDEDSDEVVEVVESEQTGGANYQGPYATEKDGLVVFSFHCGACGAVHTEKALNFHAPYPALWEELTPSQREDSKLSLDLCQINITEESGGKPKLLKASFFIRVLIEINISDTKEIGPFTWGVWVLISEEDFKRYVKNWNKEGREKDKPFFGVLQTSLPSYKAETKGLKARIYTRPVGKRPYAEIFDNASPPHEIIAHQKDGIPTKRLTEILELLHG